MSKKQQASDYLKRVRLALDPVRYQTFSAVIKSYKVDKDFEGLVRALKELFLKPTVNVELFTGEVNSISATLCYCGDGTWRQKSATRLFAVALN